MKTGRFGPYLERDGKRASIPKDVPQSELTVEMAENLLSLPREIGLHPETGTLDHRVDWQIWTLSHP